MAVQTYPAKQIARQVRLKALIYGPAGAGKTHLITTLPKPVLVLDFEGGVTTLINADGCDIVPIVSEQHLRDAIAMLRQSERYASVAFDGLSLFVRRRASELRQSKERLTWEDWQKLTSELRAVVLPLVHLPVHLLLTCLPRYLREKDERGREVGPIIGAAPDLTPALTRDLVAACDLVGYLLSPIDPLLPTDDRIVLFAPKRPYKALVSKTRLPGYFVAEPSFERWLAYRDQLASGTVPDMPPAPASTETQAPAAPAPALTSAPSAMSSPAPTAAPTAAPIPASASASVPTEEVSIDANSDDETVTRAIWTMSKQLGLDGKALGRIAKQHFGQSFVRDLTTEQKCQLLVILQELQQKRAASASASEAEKDALAEFLRQWREWRGDPKEYPFDDALAIVAVQKGWTPEELEAAVTEVLLDRGVAVPLPTDGSYWLSAVSVDLLESIANQLLQGGVE
jgi:hypothetical protein